jgi:hypothetical protein
LDEDKRSRAKGRPLRKRETQQRPPEGLEIKAAFEKWLAFTREHFRCPYSWDGPFATDLEKISAIDSETALLVQIAPQWSAEAFYSVKIGPDADVTKGSEHYVTRYLEGDSPRVVKATIPGKYGRHEYSPSLYLNSWRLFQQFLPALDIRVHGILVQPVQGRDTPLPSIVTSMDYIEGGHPSARQIGKYMKARAGSSTLTRVKRRITSTTNHARLSRDAHPGNWIKQRGTAELMPVDISIEQF